MKRSRTISTAFLLAVLLPRNAISADQGLKIPLVLHEQREYVSLYDITEVLSLDTSFDVVTQRGRIYRGANIAVYQVGLSALLLNGRLEKYSYPVTRRKGEVLLPAAFFDVFAGSFFPEATVQRSGKTYLVAGLGARRETRRTPMMRRDGERPAASKDKISFIIIDAGHGGRDPGAIGKGGVKEKSITLSVARELKSYLEEKIEGVKIILTRNSDTFIELGRRTDIANGHLREKENGMFISIHVNASISPRISGFETYFLSQSASNDDARATAALENNVVVLEDRSRRKSYDDAAHMEAFMLTAQIQRESSLLAESIQSSMDRRISEFKSRGVKKADFFVLRGSLMPAILAEIGYITNQKELGYLKKSSYQKKIAMGLGDGIEAFIKKYNELIKNK